MQFDPRKLLSNEISPLQTIFTEEKKIVDTFHIIFEGEEIKHIGGVYTIDKQGN